MRIITIIGNRPQFVKAAAVSRRLRERHEELIVHTGQHYDDEPSRIFFEELHRLLTDHASELLLCSTQTAVDNLRREDARGQLELVGDVMADVSLAFRDIAEERSRALVERGLEPDSYLLVTAHRAGNVDPP